MINRLIIILIGTNRGNGSGLPNLVKALWLRIVRRADCQPVQPMYKAVTLNPGWIGDPGADS